ncbi:MAG: aldolase catalytic domain-containing protein [Firmicutes bacterium]|nr:aldolase catalytic domain-containing protein [Bacillota bacterium]
MKQKGNLVSFRPDVKVVDVTIRDGGLVNDFRFSDEFIKALYESNIKAGVDYMEFGYKASTELFNEDEYGKWKFCKEDDIRKIVGDNDTGMKIAVMADVGRTDYKKDIIDKADSAIDIIRVATYLNTIPAAVEMAEYCKAKGYETSINIMAISNAKESDIDDALDVISRSSVDMIYVVDSYGALVPEQIRGIAEKYIEMADATSKTVGIHAHNNMQLAFANTIEALRIGVSMLDASIYGMGRGAGNCCMELLLRFLKNPKYNVLPTLDFIEKYILSLIENGDVWGYDIQYLLTGSLNQHPRTAISFTKDKRKDYKKFFLDLLDKD